MGCDIHMHAEVRGSDGKWEPVFPKSPHSYWDEDRYPRVYDGRNYRLFALLAGVRNDCGVTPIDLPRGKPDDLSEAYESEFDSYFGDHSFSWLLLGELLRHDYTQKMTQERVVSWPAYVHWRVVGGHEPRESSGGVLGGAVVAHQNSDEFDRRLSRMTATEKWASIDSGDDGEFCKAVWSVPQHTAIGAFAETLIMLLSEATKRGVPHDDVRIVFGFDS